MTRKTVTIFGSSFPGREDEEYKNAYLLGKSFGENGFDVCTGGYKGIMDAVSKGAVEAGTEATGILLKNNFSDPSEYLTTKIVKETLFERIKLLIEKGDAFVILPGGTGTLLELATIWEFFNKKIMVEKPAAALGKMWKDIIPVIEERMTTEKRKTGLIKVFEDHKKCAEYILKRV